MPTRNDVSAAINQALRQKRTGVDVNNRAADSHINSHFYYLNLAAQKNVDIDPHSKG